MNKISKLLFEFSWVKDLERIGGRIDTLHDLTFSKEIFEEQIRQVRRKIDTAQKEYDSAKKAYDDFTEASNVTELLSLDEQAEHVSREGGPHDRLQRHHRNRSRRRLKAHQESVVLSRRQSA